MKSVIKLSIAALAIISIASCNLSGGFKKLGGGVEYKILKEGSGKTTAKIGDVVTINIINVTDKDSVIMDTHKGMNGAPPKAIQIPIRQSKGKYDIMAWLMLMKKGDSAVFMLPTDSIFPDEKMRPPFIKAHSKVKSILIVEDITSAAEAQQKQMDAAKAQMATDDALIQNYIKEKGLKDVQKTESGLYYIITQKGTGANIEKGKKAIMNYTGYLLDGKMFDSNVDASKHHVEPLKFNVGEGSMIRAWDEGVLLLNKGAKAKFIVPSALGYGSQAMGQDIPANSVLVFDLELKGWE